MPSPLQVSISPLNLARYSCVNINISQHTNNAKGVENRFVAVSQNVTTFHYPQSILVNLVYSG